MEDIRQYLLSDTTRLYGILDGASVPDLPMRLYESQLPNHCLLSGDLDPDLAYVAPYLVFLSPEHDFTEWVLGEGYGNHWGIFAHSRSSMTEMRKHFRALVSVSDEAGNPLHFRYYDPRVLRQFLPTCNPDELITFFGRVDAFFAETGDGENLLNFKMENDELKQTELGSR